MNDSPERRLPAVHVVLKDSRLTEVVRNHGRDATVQTIRAILAEARKALRQGESRLVDPAFVVHETIRFMSVTQSEPRPVINATGVLLHTGLGRAPLAREAIEAVVQACRGYCNLEFDLETGRRGRRTTDVASLIRRLTGAEAATVVNNNAAATILALRALAAGREVIVSRGQLVEIGGSFRLPEIFEVSGVRLREVGTTNKTRLADYERAIGPDTAAILRVHASNYRIMGFTEEVAIADLAALGRSRGLWTIDDIGSGALGPGRPPWPHREPTVAQGLSAGADLILFSGDKMLGGPQCGVLVGKQEAIHRITRDPLMRALRVDKMTLAALGATLRLALDVKHASQRIPLWAFLNTSVEQVRERAERLSASWRAEAGLMAVAVSTSAFLGGGSTPIDPFPSAAVKLSPPYPASLGSAKRFAQALRREAPPVVGRIKGGSLLLDLRAVFPEQDALLDMVVRRLAGGSSEMTPSR